MVQKMPANRSHIEAFCFMRTSHLQRKRQSAEAEEDYQDDARVSLLGREERLELGEVSRTPCWAGKVEGLNYQISRAEQKISELNSLHLAHLSRPGMEDDGQEEEKISRLTTELTQQFGECNKQLQVLQRHSTKLRGHHRLVLNNIVTNLAARLQDSTGHLRSSQGNYLRKVEAREQRTGQFFDSPADPEDDGLLITADSSSSWQKQDLLFMEENTQYLRRREQEISSIVQSIQDLNTIFKDLAGMVSQQGEIVDRIDYNIENAGIKVEEGLEQLKKASKYQKTNRKMKCIVLLGVTLIILIFLLIILKT